MVLPLPLPLPSFLPSYFALALCPYILPSAVWPLLSFLIFFLEEEGMFRSSSISSDKILKKMFAKSNQVLKLKTGFGKRVLGCNSGWRGWLGLCVAWDDLDGWLEHGCTAGPCQLQCSTMTWIQIRWIFTKKILLSSCVYKMCFFYKCKMALIAIKLLSFHVVGSLNTLAQGE